MRVGWERWEFGVVYAVYNLFSVGEGERGARLG